MSDEHPVDCEGGWITCWECGGGGFLDAYEDDPAWYSPGETMTCMWCRGNGGWPCGVCSLDANDEAPR